VPAATKTERDLVQDNVNTVGQIFANYQAALHLFEEAVMGGAGERVPRDLAIEVLREVSRQVFEPVLDACVGVAPGMEDLVADGMGKIEDVPERETPEPNMSAPAHALRNLVIAERHRIASSQGNLIKGQISLMRLAEDRAVRGDSHRGMLVSAAMKLDELETGTHSASGILKLLMEKWDELNRGGAAVLIVLDENWRVMRAHIKMADGREYWRRETLPLGARILHGFSHRFVWDGGPVHVDGTVRAGDVLAGFEVIDLAGHAPGLIGLWRERDRVALVSDCFYMTDMHGKPQPPSVPLDAYNLDTAQAKRSIAKLAQLRPKIVCPGHLGPLTGPDVVEQLEAAAA
jgi:hypothetical protein